VVKHGVLKGMLHADGFSVLDTDIGECLRKLGHGRVHMRSGPEGEGLYYYVKTTKAEETADV